MTYKYSPPAGWVPAVTREEITKEFKRWNEQAGERVVSMDFDLPMQRPGIKLASVRFLLRDRPVLVKVEKWDDFGTNLRCCFLLIRDMRLAEARGMTEAIREAYAQLAAPVMERDPFEVLGIRSGESLDFAEAAYKAKAKQLHSDVGGNDTAMKELNAAIEKVRAEAKVTA